LLAVALAIWYNIYKAKKEKTSEVMKMDVMELSKAVNPIYTTARVTGAFLPDGVLSTVSMIQRHRGGAFLFSDSLPRLPSGCRL
jgi:hypothetical protein